MHLHVRPITAALLFAALSGGCNSKGPELGRVAGTVTLDGKPLDDAIVEFQPLDGKSPPTGGKTDAEGRYQLRFTPGKDGAFLGENRVQINMGWQFRGPPGRGDFLLPERYNNKSELTFEVKKGANQADFELKRKAD